MVNESEVTINSVNFELPKMLSGSNQKVRERLWDCSLPKRERSFPGKKSPPKLLLLLTRNTVSPYIRPKGQVNRKEDCWVCG